MQNEQELEIFWNWLNRNHDSNTDKLKKYCSHNHFKWDENVYNETVKLIANRILRKGALKDMSDDGINDFFFISFKHNLTRDSKRSFFCKRDANINDHNGLSNAQECYLNSLIPIEEKLKSDMKEDFSAIRILEEIENKFGNEVAHAFALKFLNGKTYSETIKLCPNLKDCKKKLLDAKTYIRDNFSREKLDDEFNDFLEIMNN